jgi:hypothetical protein
MWIQYDRCVFTGVIKEGSDHVRYSVLSWRKIEISRTARCCLLSGGEGIRGFPTSSWRSFAGSREWESISSSDWTVLLHEGYGSEALTPMCAASTAQAHPGDVWFVEGSIQNAGQLGNQGSG